MSSVLSAIARRAPRAARIMAGSGVGATRTRIVRMVSAWPVSGLARPAAASHPLSALAAPGTSASPPGLTHLQQQRKLLSIQSEDNHEPSEELGVAAAEEGPAAEGPAAEEWVEEEQQVEEEPGGSISSSQSPYLVQVDGLPFAMRQEEIQQWFAEAGPAPVKTTVPMWSDKSSRAGYSKGRAYLQFDSEEDTKAVLALTGKAIGERWVSITRLAIPLEAACQVTIRGLDGLPEEDVAAIFEEAVGTAPVRVNVAPNRTRGLAFAKFETPELAEKALVLDGSSIHGQWVDVSLYVTKASSRQSYLGNGAVHPFATDVPDELVVILKGLPFNLMEDEIKALLVNHEIGEEDIVEIVVPKYNQTQFNTGLALIHLRSEEAVASAVTLKGTYVGDRWVDVIRWTERSWTVKKSDHKSTNEKARANAAAALRQKHPSLPVVAISGLPFNKTQDEVMHFLNTNGVPSSAVLEMEMPLFLQTERNTGYCWLAIDDELAYRNLMELNGSVFDDRWLTINDV